MTDCVYRCVGRKKTGDHDRLLRSKGCGREYRAGPGPKDCVCGCVYIQWVNYDEWVKIHPNYVPK